MTVEVFVRQEGALALSHRLEIRQGQGLVITPQLQQAIKLLQMSNLELEAAVPGVNGGAKPGGLQHAS